MLTVDVDASGSVEARLEIRLCMSDSGEHAPSDDPVGVYLGELRREFPEADRRRSELLRDVRAAVGTNAFDAAWRRYVGEQAEVVVLLALAAAPISMRPVDAVQEANALFGQLVRDASQVDPLRELAMALPRRLRALVASE